MPTALPPSDRPVGIARGTPAYRRLTLAMFCAGFNTFALLYCAQPLLPFFAEHFHLAAERASLAVSLATAPIAIGVLFAGALSDRLGRRKVMVGAMYLAAASTLATALAPGWNSLLALRLLTGIWLAGMPGVAMAYLSEEADGASVGSAMGLYISGNAMGGLFGRLGMSFIASLAGWRWSFAAVALLGLILAETFRRSAPPSRSFASPKSARGSFVGGASALLRDPALPWLYFAGFLLMGVFVTLYNYTGFRLIGPPYGLSHAAVSTVFLLYLLGSASSSWFGGLSSRVGCRTVLWPPIVMVMAGVGLTAATPLPLVIAGIGLATIGFFGAHSVASTWVGRRGLHHRAQAAAFYLCFYYAGSSVLGTLGGVAWTNAGWPGVVAFCAILTAGALAIALRLRGVAPLPQNAAAPSPPLGVG